MATTASPRVPAAPSSAPAWTPPDPRSRATARSTPPQSASPVPPDNPDTDTALLGALIADLNARAPGLANPDLPGAAQLNNLKDKGKCRGSDPNLFFPLRGEDALDAKEVCAGCPVRAECLEYALEAEEAFGIWGGKSEKERRKLRRQRRRERRQAAAAQLPEMPLDNGTLERARMSNRRGELYERLEAITVERPSGWTLVAWYSSAHSACSVAGKLRQRKRPVPPTPGCWQFATRSDRYGSYLFARLNAARITATLGPTSQPDEATPAATDLRGAA